jgi:formate-dependent nitrite reductase membrane component NrfD
MLPCAPLLIADLGRPSRFHHMLRLFKPSSPMNLGAWALTTHGAFATLTALRALAAKGKLPVPGELLLLVPEEVLGTAGLPSALTLGGYTGVLIGTTSVPVWSRSPLPGALFMACAFSTGAAAASLLSTLTGQDTSAERAALAPLGLAFGTTELAVLGAYIATSGKAAKPLFKGNAALLLAGAVAGGLGGMALELCGMRDPLRHRLYSGLAAAATLLGGACLRWALVKAGHESAADREHTLESQPRTPSAPGWGPDGVLAAGG